MGNGRSFPNRQRLSGSSSSSSFWGQSANAIAKMLNDQGKRSINGKLWTHCTVYHILKNEKFVGDCEMQKTITKDFLTHYSTPNMGEAPRYYVKDHHVGIIDRDTWDRDTGDPFGAWEPDRAEKRTKGPFPGKQIPFRKPYLRDDPGWGDLWDPVLPGGLSGSSKKLYG